MQLLCQTALYFRNFRQTDTEVNLLQNCPTLLTAVVTLPCETKQVNLFITAVAYALKVITVTEKNTMANVQCLL